MWFHPQLWICWWSDNALLICVNRVCVNGQFVTVTPFSECVHHICFKTCEWNRGSGLCGVHVFECTFFLLFSSCTTQRPALYESFSLALLQLMSVNIPQSHSQVITDASLPHTHTGWWITIFFVRLISLLCLLGKNQAGGIWACMDVQPLMDEIYFLQMEIKWLKSSCLNVTHLRINALNQIKYFSSSQSSPALPQSLSDPWCTASGCFLLSQLHAR